MSKLLPASTVVVLVLLLVTLAYGGHHKPVVNPTLQAIDEARSLYASSDSSFSDSSSEMSSSEEVKSITLVDQDYPSLDAKGKNWLTLIGAKKITGKATHAKLHLTVSRGKSDKGWSAVGMYLAKLDERGWPDESVYGTRLHFIDAEWNGNCDRRLSPSSSFGVLHEHDSQRTFDFSSVPVTVGDDGCKTGSESWDVLSALNDGGIVIGFSPSNVGYHVTATLEYTGDLTASAL